VTRDPTQHRYGDEWLPSRVDSLQADLNPLATKVYTGGALEFTIGDKSDISLDSPISITTASFAMSFMCKVDNTGTNLVYYGYGGTGVLYVRIDSEEVTVYARDNGSNSISGGLSTGDAVSANDWHHVVVQFERGGNATCWIDGVATGTTIDFSGVTDAFTITTSRIGSQDASSNWFGGNLSNLFYFEDASLDLTDHVDWLYNGGNGRSAAEVAAHATLGTYAVHGWDLNEINPQREVADAIQDSIGTNHGTVEGAELVTNGDFATDVSDWTNNVSWPWDTFAHDGGDNSMNLANADATLTTVSQALPLTSGNAYKISFDVTLNSGSEIRAATTSGHINNANTGYASGDLLSTQSITDAEFTASGSVWRLCFGQSDGACDWNVDNVSVRAAQLNSVNGPRATVIWDEANDYDGTPTGKTDAELLDAFKSDIPDGSFTSTVADSGSGGNDGTMTGFDDVDDARLPVYPAALGSGRSIEFDGVDDVVSMGSNSLARNVSGVTLAGWIKPDDISGNQPIMFVSKGDVSGSSRAYMRLTNATILGAGRKLDEDSYRTVTSGSVVNAGEWQHVAAVLDYTNDTIEIFHNGISVEGPTSVAWGAGTTSSDTDCLTSYLGHDSVAYFGGSIDDVRVYHSALSSADIASLAGGTDVGTPYGHWSFDDEARAVANVADGASFEFDGVDDEVQVGAANASGDWTVAGWFKTSSAANQAMFGSPQVGNYLVAGTRLVSGESKLGFYDASWKNADTAVDDGEWHHVAFVHDDTANTTTIYLDGVVDSGGVQVSTVTITNSNCRIGSDNGTGTWWNGLLDDVRMYSEALDAATILALKNGTDPDDTNLEAHWSFDGGFTAPVATGDPVRRIVDSVSSDQFTNSEGSECGTYTLADSDFNDKPSLTIDGTQGWICRGSLVQHLGSPDGLVVGVLKIETQGDEDWLLSSNDEATNNYYWRVGQTNISKWGFNQRNADTAQVASGDSAITTDVIIIGFQGNGDSYDILIWNTTTQQWDEEAISGTDNGDWFGDTDLRDNLVLGGVYDNSEVIEAGMDGKIARLLVFNAVPTDSDKTKLGKYLEKEYVG
jgi:hypothetical protein